MATSVVPSGSPSPPANRSLDTVRELRFGDVSIDPLAGVVRRRGVPLTLRPKAYDVLLHFASHGGRLLSRLDVIAAVWPDVTVTDDSLVQCLVEIRRALGDAAPITTVRGRGYRFDAPVTLVERDAPADVVAPPPVVVEVAQRRSGDGPVGRSRSARWGAAAAILILLLAFGAWTAWTGIGSRRSRDVGRPLGTESLNPEAIRLLEEGRVLLQRQTRVTLLQAVDRFESAILLDPGFASAWAGKSRALTLLHIYGSAASALVLPRAKEAAQRAIGLDPTVAEGHSALAHVLEQYDRDWAAAEASHRRAVALAPRVGVLRQSYALFLVSRLRVAEALSEMDVAEALSTDRPRTRALRGIVLMYAHRPTEALAVLDAARTAGAPHSLADYWRAFVLAALGRFEEALDAAEAARVEAGSEPTMLIGVVHALAGRRAEALEVRRALAQKATTDYVPPTDFALLEAALGNDDSAVRWLERAADVHSRGVASINVHPLLRRLRTHPGYVALLARLDLPLPPQ